MARIAGRDGALYANLTSGGTPEPIAYLNSWSVNFQSDKYDVTAFGDSNKTYVSGLSDFQGQYAGFYDTASAQLYTAATDGVARKFYLYPTRNTATTYWYGTAFFDFSVNVTATGAAEISGGFAAASAAPKVG